MGGNGKRPVVRQDTTFIGRAPRKAAKAPEPTPLPPIVECPSCKRRVRALDLDGTIGYHERPAVPGEDGHSDIVPTYRECQG